MKVLYGVQGTGNGHIARAREMANALKEKGVQVDFLFSGREESKYFSMDAFGDYQTRRGLTFISKNGKVDYRDTATKNNIFQLLKDIEQLDLSGYDLVLNDFEPISAWSARKQGKISISISHQNAFRYQVPLKGASWLDKVIMHKFAPAEHYIGLHWYHFDQPILPPIIHKGEPATQSCNFFLVYLPFEDLNDTLRVLHALPTQRFICYHPDVAHCQERDNVAIKPLSHVHFQSHLRQCNGVIANGGFELPSEALALGKKLLLKPLNGQFEQMSNVATLECLGLASMMEQVDLAVIREWIDEEPAEKVVYPDVAQEIVHWLLQGDWGETRSLHSTLWQQVSFPSYATFL